MAIPRLRSRLIGRDEEVTKLVELLLRDDVPLVTVTGPGGIGKTRLALAVAAEVGPSFQDGIHLVPLASVRDAALVPLAVAETLGLREGGQAPVAELVRRFLSDRSALLVLDNCEHVVDAAEFVASVLEGCPSVTMLATSRTRLRIADEQEFPLRPLTTPAEGAEPTLASAFGSDAVRLFVDRAHAVAPRFELDDGNVAAVSEICRRLDGQPLAIELAAVRIKSLAPAALLDRLDGSLSLLVDGRRDAPARQRTLRDAIAWSYDLLSEGERVVLRRLAVFVGGFSLEAAEAVCTGVDAGAVVTVASLVDQSLVVQMDSTVGHSGDVRREVVAPTHRLLETVREFGLEQLEATGELGAVRGAHAGYFIDLAERLRSSHDHGTEAVLASDVHLGNWREVLTWARASNDRALAWRQANPLLSYWAFRCHLVEAQSWYQWILEAEDLPVDERAIVEVGVGLLANMQGHYSIAAPVLDRAIRRLRIFGDRVQLSQALLWLGETQLLTGDPEGARRLFDESLDVSLAGGSLMRDGGWAAWPLKNLAYLAIEEGDLPRATVLMGESLAVARATDQPWTIGDALAGLGDIARRQGRTADAAALFGEALVLWHAVGEVGCVAFTLGDIAMLSAGRGGKASAAELFGAQASHLARIARKPWPLTAAINERAMAGLRGGLGEAMFAAAYDKGRRIPLSEAVELGRAEAERLAGDASPDGAEDDASSPLTAREMEVVALLAAGKSNQEIADALFVSRRTASTHVSNILSKLMLANRAEAAAWAVRRSLA